MKNLKWMGMLFFAALLGGFVTSCDDDDDTIAQSESKTTPVRPSTPGDPVEMEAVDLGLPSGILWANKNVGASNASDYGTYLAWGAIEPSRTKEDNVEDEKISYSWSTYTLYDSDKKVAKKYNSSDKKKALDKADDAAYSLLGEDWRMPTVEEQDELRKECTWTWGTLNGVTGYIVKSKVNENSIFLPAEGAFNGDKLIGDMQAGCYWSSSLSTNDVLEAYCLYFTSNQCVSYVNSSRYFGRSVRAVKVPVQDEE